MVESNSSLTLDRLVSGVVRRYSEFAVALLLVVLTTAVFLVVFPVISIIELRKSVIGWNDLRVIRQMERDVATTKRRMRKVAARSAP